MYGSTRQQDTFLSRLICFRRITSGGGSMKTTTSSFISSWAKIMFLSILLFSHQVSLHLSKSGISFTTSPPPNISIMKAENSQRGMAQASSVRTLQNSKMIFLLKYGDIICWLTDLRRVILNFHGKISWIKTTMSSSRIQAIW